MCLESCGDEQSLGAAVAGVHEEHAVADDFKVLTRAAQHQLAARRADAGDDVQPAPPACSPPVPPSSSGVCIVCSVATTDVSSVLGSASVGSPSSGASCVGPSFMVATYPARGV